MLKLRLCQAARLPKCTTQSESEIARTAGFHSPFHFSWQFKAWSGMSPMASREHNRTNFPQQSIL